jgi:hypothetical protein
VAEITTLRSARARRRLKPRLGKRRAVELVELLESGRLDDLGGMGLFVAATLQLRDGDEARELLGSTGYMAPVAPEGRRA